VDSLAGSPIQKRLLLTGLRLFTEATRRIQLSVVAQLGHLESPKPRQPFGYLGFFLLRREEWRVKTVVLSVRCSPGLLSRLDTLCQASLQKRADIVRWLIAKARLDDLPQAWRDLSPEERELLQEIR
jgi:hypothetical protein